MGLHSHLGPIFKQSELRLLVRSRDQPRNLVTRVENIPLQLSREIGVCLQLQRGNF